VANNILTAFQTLATFKSNDLKNYASTYLNRINASGEQLEYYVKDAVANSLTFNDAKRKVQYNKVFSYLGNQNNPPDFIIRGGDAFEIKKIESPKSNLALNSSPPKDRLYRDDPRITEACRNIEAKSWQEKDLFYTIGHAKGGLVRYLFFVHGKCYAADKAVYSRMHSELRQDITDALKKRNLEFSKDTVELGKVRRVDPLGITELRIRGMWSIQNPLEVFESDCAFDNNKNFSAFALMKKSKFESFPKSDVQTLQGSEIAVTDVKVKDPNNPAILMDAKLITLSW